MLYALAVSGHIGDMYGCNAETCPLLILQMKYGNKPDQSTSLSPWPLSVAFPLRNTCLPTPRTSIALLHFHYPLHVEARHAS